MESSLCTYLIPLLPLKLSVIEDGLTANTVLTLKFFCGIDTLFGLHELPLYRRKQFKIRVLKGELHVLLYAKEY